MIVLAVLKVAERVVLEYFVEHLSWDVVDVGSGIDQKLATLSIGLQLAHGP